MLQLIEEEGIAIDIADEEVETTQWKGDSLCLFRKIWVDRSIRKDIIEVVMAKIWRLSAKALFREVGPNVFHFLFAMHADKQRVEDGRPWFFDNNLFVIESYI